MLTGHKLLLATGTHGVVQFCTVLEGNPADSTLVGAAIDSVTAAVGRVPRQAALDGGFASIEGLALAKGEGIKDVCFSKRRGMEIAEMANRTWLDESVIPGHRRRRAHAERRRFGAGTSKTPLGARPGPAYPAVGLHPCKASST